MVSAHKMYPAGESNRLTAKCTLSRVDSQIRERWPAASLSRVRWWLTALAAGAVAVNALVTLAATLGWWTPLFGAVRQIPHGDKYMHFSFVGFMAFALSLTAVAWSSRGTLRVLGLVGFGVALLSICEETTHRWLPGRTFSLADMTANLLGILAFGLVAAWIVAGRTHRRPLASQENAGC